MRLISLLCLFILSSCVDGIPTGDIGLKDLAKLTPEKFDSLTPEQKDRAQDAAKDMIKNTKDEIETFANSSTLCKVPKCSMYDVGFRTPSLIEDFLSNANCKIIDSKKYPDSCNLDLQKYGFQFDCSKPKEHTRFERGLRELDNMALLAESVSFMAAHQEMLKHEQALKAIPMSIAKKTYLDTLNKKDREQDKKNFDDAEAIKDDLAKKEGKSYHKGIYVVDRDKDKTKVLLPKDVKAVLIQTRQKFDKLQELKDAMRELIEPNYPTKITFEQRKENAKKLVKEYNSMRLDVKKLKDKGYEVVDYHEENFNKGLIETKSFLDNLKDANNRNSKDNVAVTNYQVNQNNMNIEENIKAMQLAQDYLKEFTVDVLNKAGNGLTRGSDPIINKDLLDNAEEMTDWDFKLGDHVDLVQKIVADKSDVNQEQLYKNMKAAILAEGSPEKIKAIEYYNTYQKLLNYKDKDFFPKAILSPIDELENKMSLKESEIGNYTFFADFKKALCGGPDCKLSEIYAAMASTGQGNELLDTLFGQLGLSVNADPEKNLERLKEARQFISLFKAKLIADTQNAQCLNSVAVSVKKSIDSLIRLNSSTDSIQNCSKMRGVSEDRYLSRDNCVFDNRSAKEIDDQKKKTEAEKAKAK
jgi:hypothetical protein